ncbi:MAG: hypothetical protein ACTHM2_11060 [Afipia sp.]
MAIAAAGHGRIDKIDDVGGGSHRWVPFHEEFFLIDEADCFALFRAGRQFAHDLANGKDSKASPNSRRDLVR